MGTTRGTSSEVEVLKILQDEGKKDGQGILEKDNSLWFQLCFCTCLWREMFLCVFEVKVLYQRINVLACG